MLRIARIISKINESIGKAVSWLLMAIMLIIVYEVVMRYVLDSPTKWSNEISQYLLVVVSMLGGAYCLVYDGHVRVDILYHRMSEKKRAFIDILLAIFVLSFVIAIFVKGADLCYEALIHNKRSNTVLGFPLFPSMVMVPIGSFLLALQAISKALLSINALITGTFEDHRANKEH